MSLLSAAAADEDGEIIQTLRAENDALKTKLMAATKSALDHVQRNRKLEAMLEAVGAGGVGPLMQSAKSNHVEQRLGMVAMPRAVVEQALEAFNVATTPLARDRQEVLKAIEALRAALEQPQGDQEPVAVISDVWTLRWAGRDPIATIVKKHGLKIGDKLYTRPQPKREPLTDEQKVAITRELNRARCLEKRVVGNIELTDRIASAIEAANDIGGEA